ncbi:MAG TPA: PKD domain-containing protein, partial [Candidatus Saccharimonadales bacterium]
NFAGTSLSALWNTTTTSATISVNNGLDIDPSGGSGGNAIYSTTSISEPDIIESDASLYATTNGGWAKHGLGIIATAEADNIIDNYSSDFCSYFTSSVEYFESGGAEDISDVNDNSFGPVGVTTSGVNDGNYHVWGLVIDPAQSWIYKDYTNIATNNNGYYYTSGNTGYVYLCTDANGGNLTSYWARTRTYPPNNVMPGVSLGSLACETGNTTYDVCLTISNPVTGCSSQSCDSVSTTAFVSSCQASFDTSVTGNQLTVTSTSTGVDASTIYTWNFGDGTIGHQPSETHTYPSSAKICSVPVTLANSIDTASAAGLQVMVTINSSQYTANENGGLQNVEFTTGNNGTGTPLQAWIESGASNTSTNTVYWINLGNSIIPANGALTIYMNFMPSNVMSASGPTGEASMLSSTYGQYDNGSLVFPNVYTTWGGLSGGSVPTGISVIGSPTITNNANYTAYVLNPNDCCTPDVLYYTNTPASAQGTTVMETYCSLDGAYMWWGTNDGQGDGDAPGIIVSWDAGCIYQDYSMKDGGNCYDLLTPVSTTPYIWTIELANNNYVTAMDNNYTQVLGPQATDQSVANPPYFGYFGTTQNDGYGGNDEADIYWTRTRIYPPGGVLPAVSFGSLACQTVVKYDVCLTISNPSTQCYSTTCDTVSFPVFISTCQAAFSSTTDDLTATFTNSSTGTNANTVYSWSFGDGGVSHQPNAIHHYGSPGNYTACLTIQNIATGCFDSVCHDLTITQCQASFTDSINNNTIMVTSTSTGTDSNTVYDWNFGDGAVGHQPSQSHTYAPSATSICGIPVALANNQNTPTPTGFQQMVTINSSLYTSNESPGLENVEFTTGAEGEGAVLQAWAESGATNSSISTVWWVNLGSATIPANGSLTIYMNFMPSNVMSPIGPTGEAPQLSGTYAQYDNGSLVFPGAYTAWGGLNGGNVPAGISTIGSPGVTNNATYTELNYDNCCSAVGAYYTSTPASASNYPTVLESYTSMQGYYMWYGTGNGEEESGTGVVICYDYPGFSDTYYGIKSDNQNYQDLTSATLTTNPVIWSILIQDTVTLNSVLENYSQVLGSETIYATNPQYYGFFGTYQNGGSDLCDIYWTRTRTYPPGGVMPGSSVGTMTCAQRGIYTVCLNINNSATGCNSSSCQNVVVGSLNPCQAGFKDSSSNTFAFFTDTSSGIDTNTTYRWNFGDGGVSHVANPTHNYSSSGTYTVCLTIQNSATGCLDSVCHSVTISQCLASFDTSVTNLVLTSTSTSIGVGVNTTYNWTFGDKDTSHRQNPSHKYKTFGTYNVCLTITDTVSGCTSTTCEKVKIGKPASVCGADFTSSTTDNGLTVNFVNTSTDTTAATQYTWSFGDGGFSHLRNPQHSYNAAGKYDVCLTITDSTESFCDSTFCDSITLIKLPDVCGADFTYSSSGFTANFTSTSTDTTTATQYRWSFGDDSISHQRNPKHNYKKAGTYTVCLTITDSTLSYCDSTLCEDVVITAPTSECTASFTWINVNG